MSTDMVDLASVASEATVTPTTDSTTTAVETPSADTDLSVIDSSTETHEEESTEGKETETTNSDGSEKTPEQQEKYKIDAAAKGTAKDILPTEARNGLKALRELEGGKYAKVVKELHGSYERYAAVKEIAPGGVTELKQVLADAGVKNFTELKASLAKHTEAFDAVGATDELLYAADPSLSQNVYDDMQAQGKEGMYGKVVSNFVQHLKEADATAYYDQVAKPLFLQGMDEAGMPGALNSLHKALLANDTATAKAITKNIADFYVNLRDEQGESAKISKERQAWEAERTTKETASQKVERTKVENGVADECESTNNTVLGKYLGGFLKLPFFKDWSRETKIDLGNGIKERLYRDLKADKQYQSQMNSLWKSKTIDRAKVVGIHSAWLQTHGDALVRQVVQTRYPGYARGGSAAGKQAAQVANKTAATAAAKSSVSTGKPIYVASKPTNLIREVVKVAGREYSTSDLDLMMITGKGFVRTNDGKSVRLVTWRKQ